MEGLIRYFVRYNLVGDLLMIALLVSGWVGLGSIKSNFFPVIESKTIQIQVIYPGASPAEVEEGIVAKIEENLQGIAGLDQVKSVCSENAGNITVTVKNANETDDILQDVKNAVDAVFGSPACVLRRVLPGWRPALLLAKRTSLAARQEIVHWWLGLRGGGAGRHRSRSW